MVIAPVGLGSPSHDRSERELANHQSGAKATKQSIFAGLLRFARNSGYVSARHGFIAPCTLV
jgi:hypothetical protein